MSPTPPRLGLLLGLAALLLGAAAWGPAALRAPARAAPHFANADDLPTVMRGRQVYALRCASCHGRSLQGQPLWQLLDEYAGRRAPAQDETGHTWQHSDEDIFQMVKEGRFPEAPREGRSYMPAFKTMLGDDEILAVTAFIKARWPIGLRVSQALLNPGYAGLPPGADRVEWRLPPTCNVLLRRQESSKAVSFRASAERSSRAGASATRISASSRKPVPSGLASCRTFSAVMPGPPEGRVPGIHVSQRARSTTWMRGSSPRMTTEGAGTEN